jgi:glycosyltransferase involved in cell wall biosynthesis
LNPRPRKPPKVLHVVGMLDRWAVETWLLRMLAHGRARGEPLDWTFYCANAVEGSRDAEAEALGARVVRSPVAIGDKLAFARALRAEVASGGYDVLHAHHDLISGLYLVATAGLPVSTRVVHAHNADEAVLTPSRLKQAVLRPALRRACLSLADKIVGNSEHSLHTLLAGRPVDPARHHVNYYGIEAGPFAAAAMDRCAFRRELGLPKTAPILLFVGRMTPEKNPVFAVDVLAALRRRVPGAGAVFAGAGDLEESVRRRAGELGLDDAVRLIGWRSDVPEIMSACDWFILPHPHEPLEGFGMAVVEAQLAGLRLLLSLGVSDAPILPGAVWRRLSLDDGAEAWAQAAAELLAAPAPSRAGALAALKASPMDMDYALDDLIGLHASAERPS